MKTARLRALIRKYGEFGVFLVGCYLLLHHLWHRRRGLLVLLAVTIYLTVGLMSRHAPSRPSLLPDEPETLRAAYTLTDLGTLPGCAESVPLGINDAGQIVGYAYRSGQGMRAFLWQKGKMTDLGSLGGPGSMASGINAKGQIVGTALTGDGMMRGYLYRDKKMQDLGTLGGEFSGAEGINASGQTVGWAETGQGEFHAFLWKDGKMTDLGAALGSYFSMADSINKQGEVAGSADYGRSFNAFYYRNGKFDKITTLGGQSNAAYALNGKGEVVGLSEVDPHAWEPIHAFLWQSGKVKDLGTLGGSDSAAYALNEEEKVVGWAYTSRQEMHAFLWQKGKMTDLNKLISKRDWLLNLATGINSEGKIIGIGAAGGKYRAFLLTPRR